MEITFHGAAREVTGSCHLVKVGNYQILMDCGLIQGRVKDETRNRRPFPFDPRKIDAVVLSHAHIDHSGRIPLLVKAGFRGLIYTHSASLDLCRIMLRDAAFLHQKDAEWANRKRRRKGLTEVSPLYTETEVKTALRQFKSIDYDVEHNILPGVCLRLRDAGHILGSAIVELWLSEGNVTRKVVFSGDLGHSGAPILCDPALIEEADLVLMESTYGDRLHRPWEETWEETRRIVESIGNEKGNILIPAFAVGRSQRLLYMFAKYYHKWGIGRWQIFLDSPMAIQATEVYIKHSDLYDQEAKEFWRRNRVQPLLPNLHLSRTSNQSMQLNRIRSGAVIIAGSGMCAGGRIKHHLKHNIWRKDCHVIISGFQAQGTTGRALVDGARYIRLWGETIRVAAQIHTVGGLSAHADQSGLLAWYGHFKGRPPLFLVHGEQEAMETLAISLQKQLDVTATMVKPGENINLIKLHRTIQG